MTPVVRDRIEQIRQGNVPEGYKKTKSGILPADWQVCTLGACLERVERPVDVQADAMYAQIGIRSHGKGLFYKEPITGEALGNKAVYWIEPDCFILNIVFAWEQAIGKTTQAERGMIGSHRFPMYRPINGNIDIDYLIFYLLTKRGTDILEAASPGGAGRNRTLGQDRFMKSRIVLPPLEEQKKIAEILSTQDKAIALQERKIEELKRFKKGCMEKMFPRKGQKVPEKRFPGFTGNWEQRKLGDISDSYSGGTPTVGVKEYYGGTIPFIRSAEIDSDSTELYITEEGLKKSSARLVSEGDILYALYGATSGEVGRARLNGAINQAILVIRPSDGYDRDYITQWLRKNKQIIIDTYLQGGQGNLSGIIIKNLVVQLPSQPEQEVIGSYFASLDHLITLHQRKLDEMQKQKKALMQLLLTGIVRVKT